MIKWLESFSQRKKWLESELCQTECAIPLLNELIMKNRRIYNPLRFRLPQEKTIGITGSSSWSIIATTHFFEQVACSSAVLATSKTQASSNPWEIVSTTWAARLLVADAGGADGSEEQRVEFLGLRDRASAGRVGGGGRGGPRRARPAAQGGEAVVGT